MLFLLALLCLSRKNAHRTFTLRFDGFLCHANTSKPWTQRGARIALEPWKSLIKELHFVERSAGIEQVKTLKARNGSESSDTLVPDLCVNKPERLQLVKTIERRKR
jgi:hypothetical protein